jgi:hypothetical protein
MFAAQTAMGRQWGTPTSLMKLIRYRSGDYWEIGHGCPVIQGPAILPLERLTISEQQLSFSATG